MATASAPALEALAYDPQTSGGLLAAVDRGGAWPGPSRAGFTVVGRVEAGGAGVSLAP